MSSPARAIAFPQLKKILFATDFLHCSAAALNCAGALAQQCGSTIHLVHVVVPASGGPAPLDTDKAVRSARSEMHKLVHLPSLANVSYRAFIARGAVAEVLGRTIQKGNVDLIVLGTHGRSGPARAHCPVLTVRS
ncbi:MAG: universal stress protein [Terriglobales bacterium]